MTNPETAADRALSRRVKQHLDAKAHGFFAVVQPGFEETALEELEEIGIALPMELAEGGIEFTGRLEDCRRVNLLSRTVTRVLMRIARFRAENFKSLERHLLNIPWELYIKSGTFVDFSIACHHSRLYHSGAVEERARRAVTKGLARCGIATAAPLDNHAPSASQTIHLRLQDDICALSLDTSGAPLYRRGYKTRITEAPLRETLAASILRAAGLPEYDTLLDPMGGSGTVALEGAMLFLGIYPGLDRSFAFQGWPAFREAAFKHLVKGLREAQAAMAAAGKTVIYRDIDPAAIAAARSNFASARTADFIDAAQGDFLAGPVPLPPGRTLLALNPPWGERLGGPEQTRRLYRAIGETLRRYYSGCGYAVIVPGLEMEKVLSLPYDRKHLFMSGGIKVGVIIKDGFRNE